MLVFGLPYVGRAAMYTAVAPVEQQLAEQAAGRRAILQARLDDGGDEHEREIHEEVRRLDRVLAQFEKKPVWKVLLNWDKGKAWPTVLAALLILYNIGIYALITRVSALRDEEERSGWTPAWREYRHLVWVHRGVVILFYVSVASFLINIGGMLGEEVLIPRFREARPRPASGTHAARPLARRRRPRVTVGSARAGTRSLCSRTCPAGATVVRERRTVTGTLVGRVSTIGARRVAAGAFPSLTVRPRPHSGSVTQCHTSL